jgi:hypothetical protein
MESLFCGLSLKYRGLTGIIRRNTWRKEGMGDGRAELSTRMAQNVDNPLTKEHNKICGELAGAG